jgi:glycosyltransferase involved in cell wall biosynthesis
MRKPEVVPSGDLMVTNSPAHVASAKRLRILFVCAYVPALGMSGGALRMFHIIRGASAHHAVTVLCFRDTEEELEHVAALEAMCERVEVIERGQSLDDWVHDPLHLVPRSISLEFGNPLMRRRVFEEVSSGMYDLAQFEFLDVAYLLPRGVRIPTILTHIEVASRVMAQRVRASKNPLQKLSLLTQWVRALHFEATVSKRFTTNVFLTEPEAESIVRFTPTIAYAVNHLGVDCNYFTRGVEPVVPGSLVYMGYYRHRPNVEAVLFFCQSVLPRIWAQRPDTTFNIVGGSPPEEIHSLAEDPRIRVVGWVNDYRPWLLQAEALVAPLLSGAGMRTKIIEAWASGKAVVATPLAVEGCGAIEGHNVLVAREADAFASQVLRILTEPDLRDRLADGGRRTAETAYDWDVILRQHDRIYYDTIQRYWDFGLDYAPVSARRSNAV